MKLFCLKVNYCLSIEIVSRLLVLHYATYMSLEDFCGTALLCSKSHLDARYTKYAECTHVHTHWHTVVQVVVQTIGYDVIIENLFSQKDSSDYDHSQAFLATLH